MGIQDFANKKTFSEEGEINRRKNMSSPAGQAALDLEYNLDNSAPTQDNTAQIDIEEVVTEMATAPQPAPAEKEPSTTQSKGRPRSEKSRKNILKATNSLLLHKSVQELSIEAIAKKAKVGKTTIYRWWPNKAAVVMDALISQPGLAAPLPTPKNNAEAITLQLEKLIRMLNSNNGDTIAQLFLLIRFLCTLNRRNCRVIVKGNDVI